MVGDSSYGSRSTRHPTAAWLAQQITEAFPWASAPAYLVRDNDRAYGHVFTTRVTAMGIRDRPISPGSPWQNGIAERLIGTLRRECLDHMVVFGEAHLRRILSAYAVYYNQTRTGIGSMKKRREIVLDQASIGFVLRRTAQTPRATQLPLGCCRPFFRSASLMLLHDFWEEQVAYVATQIATELGSTQGERNGRRTTKQSKMRYRMGP
jgi:hypothetical protein